MTRHRRILLMMGVFLAACSFAFAGPAPVTGSPIPAPASATSQDSARVGVAAAVAGTVEVARPGQIGRNLQGGAPIYLGDVIKTDAQGHMQILLLDQTVFTVGPNSSMVIDEFVYDPTTDAGKLNARIVKGVFRFITGKIARKKPSNMEVKLPVGVLGVRGTIVAIQTEGEKTLAILYGPGERNNIGQKPGSFILTNTVGNQVKETTVIQAGRGSVIEGVGSFPSSAFQVPKETIMQMNQSLSPPPTQFAPGAPGAPGPGGPGILPPPPGGFAPTLESENQSPTQFAGQPNMAGDLRGIMSVGNLGAFFGFFADPSRQPPGELSQVVNGVTHLQDLLKIPFGEFHISQTGVPTMGGQTYDIQFNVNFAMRKIGGGGSPSASKVFNGTFPGGQTYQFNLPALDFGAIDGGGFFHYNSLPKASGTCMPNCTADVNINFRNQNGIIAQSSEYNVVVHKGASTDSGGGNSPRLGGIVS